MQVSTGFLPQERIEYSSVCRKSITKRVRDMWNKAKIMERGKGGRKEKRECERVRVRVIYRDRERGIN